jgi:hypothetical protein
MAKPPYRWSLVVVATSQNLIYTIKLIKRKKKLQACIGTNQYMYSYLKKASLNIYFKITRKSHVTTTFEWAPACHLQQSKKKNPQHRLITTVRIKTDSILRRPILTPVPVVHYLGRKPKPMETCVVFLLKLLPLVLSLVRAISNALQTLVSLVALQFPCFSSRLSSIIASEDCTRFPLSAHYFFPGCREACRKISVDFVISLTLHSLLLVCACESFFLALRRLLSWCFPLQRCGEFACFLAEVC